MTFLPKSAEVRQELLTLLIAVPMSLIGTGFLFFLADVGNRVIRALLAATGSVTTLAGSASSPLNWLDGVGSAAAFSGALAHLALDAAAPTGLWVADAGAHALRAIALSNEGAATVSVAGVDALRFVIAPAKLEPEKLYVVATTEYIYFGGDGLGLEVVAPDPDFTGEVWQTPVVEWLRAQKSNEKKPIEALLKSLK
jgi:hypothetical protein